MPNLLLPTMSDDNGPTIAPEFLGSVVLLLVFQEVLEQIRHCALPLVAGRFGMQTPPVMTSRSTRIVAPGGKLFSTGAEIPPAPAALSMNARSCSRPSVLSRTSSGSGLETRLS